MSLFCLNSYFKTNFKKKHRAKIFYKRYYLKLYLVEEKIIDAQIVWSYDLVHEEPLLSRTSLGYLLTSYLGV